MNCSPEPLPEPLLVTRALILGGTAEAVRLATELSAAGFAVINSLVGATSSPKALDGEETRFGGFGGSGGLADYLQRRNIQLVIDATHPFAARISQNVFAACEQTATPRLALHRRGWEGLAAAHRIDDLDQAIPHLGRVNFLALGSRGWRHFAAVGDKKFILRSFATSIPLPSGWVAVAAARGYSLVGETACFKKYLVDTLVCRNSGGEANKLRAAAALGIKVVMLNRPPPPPPPRVATVAAALAWAGDMMMARRV